MTQVNHIFSGYVIENEENGRVIDLSVGDSTTVTCYTQTNKKAAGANERWFAFPAKKLQNGIGQGYGEFYCYLTIRDYSRYLSPGSGNIVVASSNPYLWSIAYDYQYTNDKQLFRIYDPMSELYFDGGDSKEFASSIKLSSLSNIRSQRWKFWDIKPN